MAARLWQLSTSVYYEFTAHLSEVCFPHIFNSVSQKANKKLWFWSSYKHFTVQKLFQLCFNYEKQSTLCFVFYVYITHLTWMWVSYTPIPFKELFSKYQSLLKDFVEKNRKRNSHSCLWHKECGLIKAIFTDCILKLQLPIAELNADVKCLIEPLQFFAM